MEQPENREQPLFVIREGVPGDLPFIYDNWMKDFHERSQFARRIRPATYNKFHKLLLDRCLANSITLVACDPEMPSVIYGILVVQPSVGKDLPVLHYVFVKRQFRLKGVAAGLMAFAGLTKDTPFWFSHMTYAGETLWKLYPRAEYCPYAV
jgi:hypothetical protein